MYGVGRQDAVQRKLLQALAPTAGRGGVAPIQFNADALSAAGFGGDNGCLDAGERIQCRFAHEGVEAD